MSTLRRATVPLLVLTVGNVLADSAVVTLALPAILRELGGSVGGVAWVLISFNLVLAALAVPTGYICTRYNPGTVAAGGMVVFAGACAVCAMAPSMAVLIAARSAQAVGGAFAVLGCLELLVAAAGEQRGRRLWTTAGVAGAASGPMIGGVLTEMISWQSIFIVEVPVTLLVVPVAWAARNELAAGARPMPARRHRPAIGPNLSVVFLYAALTAALFLVVLLLVEGWRHSPLTAAVTVSVVPVSAVMAPTVARAARAGPGSEVVTGCLLIGGGLTALALLPAASLGWVIAPQALIGLGLGMTVDALTSEAMADREPRVLHGGWTISARHAGVVLGLAVLTPVFTADLQAAETPTTEAIAAVVLDAPLRPETKIDLANGLTRQLLTERGRVPDLRPAFASLDLADEEERIVAATVARDLDEQLERAATRAFQRSFIFGAVLALMAIVMLVRLPVPAPVAAAP